MTGSDPAPNSGEAEQYARSFAVVEGARVLDGARRAAFIARACGTDAALRRRVEALLALGEGDDTNDAFAEEHIAGARRGIDALVDGPTADWLPERIGDYTIVRQIGQGGMGVVYEAEQPSPHRRVAIKLLHPMHATAERLRRFRHEAELLGRLQHPGIAQIHEAGTYDIGRGAQPFFAMELVDGVDIRAHCERHGLDRAARIEMLACVADAVQYAHDRGVIHRDLKPDNVLVDARGHPRILDFGVARATGHSATLSTIVTEEGKMVGTLAYMAPEQLRRADDAITEQVDVYALGVMGFELLVGRLPHVIDDLGMSQAIAMLSSREPPRASAFDTSLRGDVETILGKALETEPERRYQAAAALAGDLRRHLANEPIKARPPSRIYLARKFTRRHRALVIGTAATVLTLLAGAVVAVVLAGRAEDQRVLAVEQSDRATANERLAYNRILQSSQILIDAGRERDAVAQLRLVPDASRGVAWRLLDRATPYVMDAPPGWWEFVNDELMVGAIGAEDRILLYSLTEHRVTRELFRGEDINQLGRPARCGIVPAILVTGRKHPDTGRNDDEMLLLDLEHETILARSPFHVAHGRSMTQHWFDIHSQQWLGEQRDGGYEYDAKLERFAEVSDDGRTVLWYTSVSEAEVRVDGAVVRVFSGLTHEESVHLGPDGRLLVENRREAVTVTDVATEDVRFHHFIEAESDDSEGAAFGLPVAGGILLVSAPEHGINAGAGHRRGLVCRRLALADDASRVEIADPFVPGFVARGTERYAFNHPRDGRFVAFQDRNSGGAHWGAYLAWTETGAPLTFEGITSARIFADGSGRIDGFLRFPEQAPARVRVSPSGRRLAVVSGWAQTGIIELDPRVNDPQFDQRVLTLRGHTGPHNATSNGWIYHQAVSNDGSLIASAAPLDALVRVWDARTGVCIATLERECHDPGSWDALLAFAPDDDRLSITTPFAGPDVRLVEWNLLTGETQVRAEMAERGGSHLELLDAFVDTIAPAPRSRLGQRAHILDDRALAVVFPETHAKLHAPGNRLGRDAQGRPREGRRWRYVPRVEGWAAGVGVHPDAPRVAVVEQERHGAARDGRLAVIDTTSGAVLVERELDYQPWCCAYSPDGSVLAIGTHEGRVLLYETETYTRQLQWPAHEKYVYSIAWTPDGTRLVTASGDATLKTWDTRTRVASLLEEERWSALQEEMATREDLRVAFDRMEGAEREAARVELIRRAHAR